MPAPIISRDQSGLAEGITSIGSAFSQALQKRGALQDQNEQMNALQKAMSAVNPDDPLTTQMSAFQSALSQSGSSVSPKTALEYMKLLGEQNKRKSQVDPVKRGQYNQNAKLVAGLQGDARKALPLLKEAQNVLEAITSNKLPGTGIGGLAANIGNYFKSKSPKEIQTLKSIAKRTLIDLGDTKGIRLTDSKLRMLEDNLFNPNKSPEENLEAFRLWYDTVQKYALYPQAMQQVLQQNPEAIYDPLLEDTILNLTEQLVAEQGSIFKEERKEANSFADLVRKRKKK